MAAALCPFGACLPSTVLLPVSSHVGAAAWIWHLWPVVGWGDRLGLVSPLVLGLGLMALGARRTLSRFWTGLAGLWLLAATGALFANSALLSGGLFEGFTGFVGRSPLFVIVGMVLVAAGAEWTGKPEMRSAGRICMGIGALVLLAFSIVLGPGGPLVASDWGTCGGFGPTGALAPVCRQPGLLVAGSGADGPRQHCCVFQRSGLVLPPGRCHT